MLSAPTTVPCTVTGALNAVTSDSTVSWINANCPAGISPRSTCPTAVPSKGTDRPTQLVCRTECVPSTILMYIAVPAGPGMDRYTDSPVRSTTCSMGTCANAINGSRENARAPSCSRRDPGRKRPSSSLITSPAVSRLRSRRSAVEVARSV